MARVRPFRFETLLRVRSLQEDQKAQDLAEVRRQIALNEEQRAGIQREQMRMLREAGERAQEGAEPRDIQRYYHYERYLARLAVEKDATLHELRRTAEERRAELEEAMKKRKVVERIQEKNRAALNAQTLGDEQKLTDEISANRAAMKGMKKDRS